MPAGADVAPAHTDLLCPMHSRPHPVLLASHSLPPFSPLSRRACRSSCCVGRWWAAARDLWRAAADRNLKLALRAETRTAHWAPCACEGVWQLSIGKRTPPSVSVWHHHPPDSSHFPSHSSPCGFRVCGRSVHLPCRTGARGTDADGRRGSASSTRGQWCAHLQPSHPSLRHGVLRHLVSVSVVCVVLPR